MVTSFVGNMIVCGIKSFVISFGILSLFSWSLWTVTVSQISSIEKAFGLSSSESGWLLTTWEIGYIIIVIVSSYFSPKAHLTRMIGVATICCALSAWVFALPHFVAYSDSGFRSGAMVQTAAKSGSNIDKLCSPTTSENIDTLALSNRTDLKSSNSVATSTSSKTLAYALFVTGMTLQGAGKAPCYPYSSQYVDDNVDKQKTGFYISIISSIGIFGLAGGYGLGSVVNNIYVTLQDTHLTNSDPRFIGAWWLAFVIIGVTTFCSALPMFCFPRHLKRRDTNIAASTDYHTLPHTNRATHELKYIVSVLWVIGKSPLYLLVLCGSVCQILSFGSFLGFEPKYMESQFSIPPWKANIILGVVSISAFCLGTLASGYLTKRVVMTPFTTIKVILIFYVAVIGLLVIIMFLGCVSQDIVNPLLNTSNSSSVVEHGCNCNGTEFLPVCSSGVTYFSPCHAGCTHSIGQAYFNCSLTQDTTAINGLCDSGCEMAVPYSVMKFVLNFVDAIIGIPSFLVFLRSTGEQHKALALGVSAAAISLLAWLPAPVIGGLSIDSSCLIWNTASTGFKYCSYYDLADQRFKLHGIMIGFRLIGIVFLVIALWRSRRMRDWAPSTGSEIQDGGEKNGHRIERELEILENHEEALSLTQTGEDQN